ncbi:MAG: aminotransferase class III-fold pyridoxal phosphate-dependent enzyme [Rubrivivax sp.]
MPVDHDQLVALDRAHLVHPVAAWRQHEARGPRVLASGRGIWLTDDRGHELLDAFAGLWCVNIGYGQQSVIDAVNAQLQKLPYATGYFGFASEPAIRLAARLAEITPPGLNRAYLTLGGSEAIDAAVRLIVQYWNARGQPQKKHFLSLQRGYHGSSSTGAGLTALPVFHRGFDLPLATQHYLPSPDPYRHPMGSGQGGDDAALIAASVQSLREQVAAIGAERVAAFFCEPIQGSGGVIVPPAGWLRAMREATRELGILMVVDEVITGFGRTGPMFACDAEGVSPDLMTMAKGITSGYVPLGATMLSDEVYATIADAAPPGAAIGHGATYSAHPVAAAAALEVLRLYVEGGILAHAQRMGPVFAAGLHALADHPLVGHARCRGLLGALELVADKGSKRLFDPALGLPDRVGDAAWRNGIVFRCFGDGVLGFAPILTTTESEYGQLFDRLKRTLDEVLAQPEVRAALEG